MSKNNFSKMAQKLFLAIAVLGSVAVSIQARSEPGRSAFHRLDPGRILRGEGALTISFGNEFIAPGAIAADDPALTLLNQVEPGPLTGTVFFTRASYDLPIPTERLDQNLFQDFRTTQFLLGENYELTELSRSPFRFRGTRRISLGLTSSELQSTSALTVLEWNSLPAQRKQLFQSIISTPGPAPVRLVFQAITDFNQYTSKGFLLTVIYPGVGPGYSRIELYSATVLNENEVSLIPNFVRNGVIRNVAEADLVGYNSRLIRLFSR